MKRTVIVVVWISLLVPILSLPFGPIARAQQPASSGGLAGPWIGGYALGSTWTAVIAELNPDQNGGYLVPQGGQRPFALRQLALDGTRVYMELVLADDVLTFEGEWADGALSGRVFGQGVEGSFFLVRQESIPQTAYDPIIGYYEGASGRSILLTRADGMGQFFYLEADREVFLFPIGGERLLSAAGEELDLAYDVDGRVSGIYVRPLYGEGAFGELLRRTEPYREEQVRFRSGSVSLAGTLLAPTDSGPHPGVILLHGADASERQLYRAYADYFARHGIVALIYDRRGSGESTGYAQEATLQTLAGDALAGLQFLIAHPAVRGAPCGVWGISQGARLAPMVAALSPEVAFVVALSAPGASPNTLNLWQVDRQYRLAGYGDALADIAVKVARATQEARRLTGRGAAADANQSPEMDWRQVTQPVLLLYGAQDGMMPAQDSAANISRALAAAGNPHYRVLIFPGADHNLMVPLEGGFRGLAPDLMDTMTEWLAERAYDPFAVEPQAVSKINPQPTDQLAAGSRLGPTQWYQGALFQGLLAACLALALLWMGLGRQPGEDSGRIAGLAVRVICGVGLLALAGLGWLLWPLARSLSPLSAPIYMPTMAAGLVPPLASLAALLSLGLLPLTAWAWAGQPWSAHKVSRLLVGIALMAGLIWLVSYWHMWGLGFRV